jgi:hypothetical protein
VEVADSQELMVKNMKDAYQGVAPDRTDAIFHKVIKLLVTVRNTIVERNLKVQGALQSSVTNGSTDMQTYQLMSLQASISNMEYSESEWFRTVIKQVYDRVNFDTVKGVLTLLDAEENMLLLAALPMFYAGYMNEKAIYVIRQTALNIAL